jgi:hypothetical protein
VLILELRRAEIAERGIKASDIICLIDETRKVVVLFLVTITALITWRIFTGHAARQIRALGVAPVAEAGTWMPSDEAGGGRS